MKIALLLEHHHCLHYCIPSDGKNTECLFQLNSRESIQYINRTELNKQGKIAKKYLKKNCIFPLNYVTPLDHELHTLCLYFEYNVSYPIDNISVYQKQYLLPAQTNFYTLY